MQCTIAPPDSGENLNQTPVQASAQGAAQVNTATLTHVVGSTTYLKRALIVMGGSTAGLAVVATITGLIGGNVNIPVVAPLGALVAPCIIPLDFGEGFEAATPASDIALSMPSGGVGNLAAGVFLWGVQIPD